MKTILKKGPAVVFDVEGVLKKGNIPLRGSSDSLLTLSSAGIPFVLLSNSGNTSVSQKLLEINSVLKLPRENQLAPEQLILSHSPLANLKDKFLGKMVLVAGDENVHEIIRSYGITNYLTVHEYSRLYPFLVPNISKNNSVQETTLIRETVQKRIGMLPYNVPRIDIVLVMGQFNMIEEALQIVSDILISPDGKPGKLRKENEKQVAKMIVTDEDLVFQHIFNTPRFSSGIFTIGLKALFKQMYDKEIEYEVLGKPGKAVFEMAKERLVREDYEITEHFIIGDNPEIDIKGGYANGFTPILVESGIHKRYLIRDEQECVAVKDVRMAVEYIITSNC